MSELAPIVAESWEGDRPGTLALVIGVSRYPALARLKGQVPDRTYGLSELSVSSFTAYQFMSWLKDSYRSTESPLVRCWLLASPTAEEVEAEPGLEGVAEPTFRNCEDAIWAWYTAASGLSAEHAQKSRLVLFFSGHGLERSGREQLLLPSDYLDRGLINRAINVGDLSQGLASCGVPQQLFLIDACRNDTRQLRDLGFSLTGTQVLNPVSNARTVANLDAPILYGASSGQQAFAPRTVREGMTLFGQALLSGLTTPPAPSVERDQDRCVVLAHQLQRFMTPRIAEILASYKSDAEQLVKMGGDSTGTFVVTEIACDAAVGELPPSVRASEASQTETVRFRDPTTGQLLGTSESADPFGDPVMAELWNRGRLTPFGDAGYAPEHALIRVDRRGTTLYDLVVRIEGDPPDSILWLPAEPADDTAGYRCHLPYVGTDALYALHLTRDESGSVVHVEADLDLDNTGLLGRTAQAWRTYREENAAAAASILTDDMLAPVVRGETPSPLPLVIGSLLRLLSGQGVDRGALEKAMIFSSWSDLAVLIAESRRLPGDPAFNLTSIADLAVPHTASVMAMAWHLLDSDQGGPALGQELARLMPRTEPGSLFQVTFVPAPAAALA